MEFESAAAGIRFFDNDKGVIAASFSGGEQKDRVQVFRTKDGGQNWQSELVGYGSGVVFLSPDARFVTIQNTGKIRVLRYTGKE
jgi:photosystem II stability/assembly factor-like uncharacterized protein